MNLLGTSGMDFNVTDQLLIRYSAFKMCLNETYSKVSVRKTLSGVFSVQNGLK
jgi:hypothetical protein